MDLAELEQLLEDLRRTGDDHHTVEAKRAASGLPSSTWETLSAFSNAEGGYLLFGVDETSKSFDVTGIEKPGEVADEIRAVCDELEPPPRPVITTVHHPDGPVVVAEVGPLPRHQRPCHRRKDGPREGSYIRVGDGDQKLSGAEVDEMLANASAHDYSLRPAAPRARLDESACADFAAVIRTHVTTFAEVATADLLARRGVTHDGQPTLAGVLLLGADPAEHEASARATYRRHPLPTDPPGTRFAGRHFEGTVGELLEQLFDAVVADLATVQVSRGGQLADESDVAREALREMLSNALIHRSFTPAMAAREILVEVTADAVAITSPGGLHVGVDPERLGLGTVGPVRNNTLVRIGEMLRTPRGNRIVEHQSSGIPTSDAACRHNATMPPLFTNHPAEFSATLLRRSLDTQRARDLLEQCDVEATDDFIRLVSALLRFERLRGEAVGHELARLPFDALMAARVLSPCSLEDGAAALRALQDADLLRRRAIQRSPSWELKHELEAPSVAQPLTGAPKPDGRKNVAALREELLQLLVAADGQELRPAEVKELLSIRSPTTLNKLLTSMAEAGLIEPTESNPHHPRKAFRLTRKGKAAGRVRA